MNENGEGLTSKRAALPGKDHRDAKYAKGTALESAITV